jgi:4-amino-4-deoxy-L-arabinose transferase and related glycosyltransferases of PMT family
MTFMRRHWPFLLILLGTAVVRFVILFVSQTHVTSDEAIEGLMAKHILEGRAFPFYFYGTSYNASCAWEAYLAVIPFAIAGVNVVALKLPIVLLSLICLALFYVMAMRLYSIRVATWAALIYAFWPSLAKWHYQPRGYAFYFLFIPLLIILFLMVEKSEPRRGRDFFLFGLVCGIALWSMELLLITIIALWLLLLLRRRFSFSTVTIALSGFAIGYAPAICWNLTHSMRNWHFLFFEKPEAGDLVTRFGLQAWGEIFLNEMPKFFSADTVLWYYPEAKWAGYALYGVTAIALIVAVSNALRWKSIREGFGSGFTTNEATRDLLMFILIAVSFVPYLIAPLRVPGYFLAAVFFMSILLARCVNEWLSQKSIPLRAAAVALLCAVIVCGVAGIIESTHNEIETLTFSANRHDQEMIRVPGADIDAVKKDIAENGFGAVWTTMSFVYPLIFESNEKLVASESIFGIDRPVYPSSIPKSEPSEHDRAVFVVETNSPFRQQIEETLALKSDTPPRVRQHGTLTVIEQRFPVDPP